MLSFVVWRFFVLPIVLTRCPALRHAVLLTRPRCRTSRLFEPLRCSSEKSCVLYGFVLALCPILAQHSLALCPNAALLTPTQYVVVFCGACVILRTLIRATCCGCFVVVSCLALRCHGSQPHLLHCLTCCRFTRPLTSTRCLCSTLGLALPCS